MNVAPALWTAVCRTAFGAPRRTADNQSPALLPNQSAGAPAQSKTWRSSGWFMENKTEPASARWIAFCNRRKLVPQPDETRRMRRFKMMRMEMS